ncbi:MAG: hypothetical protein Q8N90_04105 [bacterium]|nr:hypothetical protein [bacterium]
MAEIPKKPPSYIRIRTLQNDAEEMRQSGGEINTGRILGKKMEDLENNQPIIEEAIFEEKEMPLNQNAAKKNKILPIAVILIIVFLFGAAVMFFVVLPKSKNSNSLATPTATPQYASLLQNFSGEKVFLILAEDLNAFEKGLTQEFKKLEPDQSKEIVFLKDANNTYPANSFLMIIYSNFPEISLTDIPDFENNFAFIIFQNQLGENNIGYVLKINDADLPTFTLASLKTKFATTFERFLEAHYDLLASQYLENAGEPQGPFLGKAVGPINTRYLKFSTGKEFYYGFYQSQLIIATSQDAFQKILGFLLPKI